MNLAAKIGHDALLADHPFVARLSRLMKIGAAGLTGLELIMVSERLVKKRKDLVVVGKSIAIFVSSRTATRSVTRCFAAANGKS
jgi:hypothetical protein